MLYLATQLENILETILEKTLKNETRGTNQNQRMNENGVEGSDNLDKVINAGIKVCVTVILLIFYPQTFLIFYLLYHFSSVL